MDSQQAQQLINDVLQHAFNREKFTYLIRNLLNHIEPRDKHYNNQYVPETYREHIEQYWRVGKYVSPEGDEVDILVVEVKSLSKLERARTTLRNFAIDRLIKFEKEYSLIAFYSKEDNGADWRFSYIKIEHEAYLNDKGKVKTRTELTPARRYSFLVGEHENSYTARKQLLPLLEAGASDPTLKDIEQAFSIEKVTQEFFQQYKELYIKLSEQLKNQALFKTGTEAENTAKVVRFAKKLLGQIVFLYFLQKKGWLGVAQDEAWGTGDKRFLSSRYTETKNYHADFLQYLFYEALAQERGADSWYGNENFNCKIPFLNGGLFEADYDWKTESIEIPNILFRNQEKNSAGDIGTGILDVFDRYNFTIREDEPLEKEVAIDPEMLGKVFENMLEVSDRKSKGAFYTPREIVHYMCQESLIHYLDDALEDISKKDLEVFIRTGHLFLENERMALLVDKKIARGELKSSKHGHGLPDSIRTNAVLLDDKLAHIKICDPAIGSGAFPVGLLHEIVNARLLLQSLMGGEANSYALKRHCIQESIYGVDIDGSAIDISRLRLWLSLIVDETDYGTIEALPNLDYKIMQGNSLVENYHGVELFNDEFINQKDTINAEITTIEKQQKQLEQEYSQLIDTNQLTDKLKKQFKTKSTKLRNKKTDLHAIHSKQGGVFDLVNEAKLKAEKLEKLHKDFFSTCSPVKKGEIREQISRLEWELIEATLKERNEIEALAEIQLLKQSNDKPFFLWKLNFPEVFKQQGGFDVVIGNPPYVQIQKFSGQQIQKDLEQQNYATFAKTGDIYCLFYEKANRLLRDNGISCFITSNKWMRAGYGKKLRQFLVEKTQPLKLIDFSGFQVFNSATVDSNILLSQKTDSSNSPYDGCTIKDGFTVNTSLSDYFFIYSKPQPIPVIKTDAWVIASLIEQRIKARIEAVGTPLKDWDVSIYRGILTGLNEAFIIDTTTKERLCSEDSKSLEIIKPILRGRDIKRYQVNFANLWIIETFPALKINIDNYPTVKEYLKEFLPKLKQTGESFINKNGEKEKSRKKTVNQWFETQDPISYFKEFEKEKITWGNLALSAQFALAPSAILINAPSPLIAGGSKYLLAILNSKLGDYYIRSMGVTRSGGYFEYKPMFVENLPIIQLLKNKQKPFETLINYVLLSKDNDLKLQAAYFEQLIDGLVFELYFTEEMKTANKPILKHLGELKSIGSTNLGLYSEAEKLAIIQSEFDRLYDPNHPVRNHLETLDSIEEIKIIKDGVQT